MLDTYFPRSMAASVQSVGALIQRLEQLHAMKLGRPGKALLRDLTRQLRPRTIDWMVREDLHGLIDGVQVQLGALSNQLGRAFFGWED